MQNLWPHGQIWPHVPSDGLSLAVQSMQGAEDDDSWMRDGADVLEKELAARQEEMEASASGKPPKIDFDPEDLAERMKVALNLAADMQQGILQGFWLSLAMA